MISDNKRFKSWPFFATKLTGDLLYKDKFLDIPDEKGIMLCDVLGLNYYTYLTLGDGCDFEVLRVCVKQGKLYVEREIEGTRRKDWPCGTCLEFHFTNAAWCDMARNLEEVPEQENTCPQVWSGTICIGRWDYTVEDGLITGRECNNNNIPHNVVENPTICFDKDGCIEEVTEGQNSIAVVAKCNQR